MSFQSVISYSPLSCVGWGFNPVQRVVDVALPDADPIRDLACVQPFTPVCRCPVDVIWTQFKAFDWRCVEVICRLRLPHQRHSGANGTSSDKSSRVNDGADPDPSRLGALSCGRLSPSDLPSSMTSVELKF